MRDPAENFKKELEAFRTSPASPCGSAVSGLLDRWRDDDRAEKVWRDIRLRGPGLSAAVLIRQVIDARFSAVASVNRVIGVAAAKPGRPPMLRGFNAEWADFLPALKERLRYELSGSPLPLAVDVAAALEQAASDVRRLHDFYFGHGNQVQFPLKRQGSNDDLARVAFYKLMTDYFQKHCSLKLPEEVAVLAEIAIPGKELDANDVTNALKPRRSKRSPSK
jgi:hypothetical protein